MKSHARKLNLALKIVGLVLVLGWLSPVKLNSLGRSHKTGPPNSAKERETHAGSAENGRKLFAKVGCYECHGLEGQGSFLAGPRIGPKPIPYIVLVLYVRRPAGAMPPYSEMVLSDKDLADIYAFLEALPPARDLSEIPILH
jgi:ubiquinol-cytochrome c reductase cytochrome c subunit